MKSITIRLLFFVLAFFISTASALFAQAPPKVSDLMPLATGQFVDYNQYDTASAGAKPTESQAYYSVLQSGLTYQGDTGVALIADSLGFGDPSGMHKLHYRFNAAGDLQAFGDTALIGSVLPAAIAANATAPNAWVDIYRTDTGTNVVYPIMTFASTYSGLPMTVTVTGEYAGAESVSVPAGKYSQAYRFELFGKLVIGGGLVTINLDESDWLVTGIGIVKTNLPQQTAAGQSVGGREKEMTSFGVKSSSVAQVPTMSSSIRFYPDPATEVVTLALDRPAKQVFLYDAAGRMVRSFALSMHSGEALLDVKDLPNGVYLARVQYADGSMQSGRIAVHH